MHIFSRLFSICFLLVLFEQPARAYLDPGSGSLVIQGLAAGVLGALFTIKLWYASARRAILRLFGGRTGIRQPRKPADPR